MCKRYKYRVFGTNGFVKRVGHNEALAGQAFGDVGLVVNVQAVGAKQLLFRLQWAENARFLARSSAAAAASECAMTLSPMMTPSKCPRAFLG